MHVLGYQFERQWHRRRLGLRASVLLCTMLLTAGCDVKSPNNDDLGLTPGISGVITDATTKRAVAGETIVVQEKSATSPDDGRFAISSLEDGTWRVQVSHPNYVSASRNVRIVSFQTAADFALEPR